MRTVCGCVLSVSVRPFRKSCSRASPKRKMRPGPTKPCYSRSRPITAGVGTSPRRPDAWPRMRAPTALRRKMWTSGFSPPGCPFPTCRIPTSLSAPAGNSESATSCCGNRRIASSTSAI